MKIQVGKIFNNAVSKNIIFPETFTNPPVVMATVSSINSAACFVIVMGITATSFNSYVYDSSGSPNGAQDVTWIAIGI